MDSMRDIIKEIMNSDVPVVVYVSPSGSRAASAGVFITLAAHFAVMAPGTNIGAAHPVELGGSGETSDDMASKIENDAAAYIISIAEKHGRNAEWAERAVRESISAPETEALEQNVIDKICADISELLNWMDGKTVSVPSGEVTLNTKNASIQTLEMGHRYRFLNTLSNPTVAYIFMLLGMYGLFFELSNPGSIFPGVLGGLFLILAFFAFQTLPINYAGLALILFAIVLFIAEIKVASYGLLTVGGIISMIIGSVMLFKTPAPFLRVSWQVIIPAALGTAAFFAFAVSKALLAQRRKPTTGRPGILGEKGTVASWRAGSGKIFVHGEYWDAVSDEQLEPGDRILVSNTDEMRLKVTKIREGAP
jgi:membrane-bound serine protease (ClpP class)